ncbi:MAG: 5'/3'-nucleotidase SurE [Bradymonadales bacterium]|nr:MAG: 5'/3'-nucleotidase SurE [Bradymonadales bacterium]
MLILVSNDDGFFTEGIRSLAKALKKIGDVWVVAPDREQSASGHSLTLHRPLRVKKVSRDHHEYAVDGTPTDCVNLAINRLLPRKPDIVVSGINRGANLGDDVTYSGTVAAALEAALLGVPAIAVSAIPKNGEDEYSYDGAADFAAYLAQKTVEHSLEPYMILNVNVPSETEVGERRCVICKMGKRVYDDVLEERIDPRGRPYYWLGGASVKSRIDADTDCEAAEKNRISLTPIQLDMTKYSFLPKLQSWGLEQYGD